MPAASDADAACETMTAPTYSGVDDAIFSEELAENDHQDNDDNERGDNEDQDEGDEDDALIAALEQEEANDYGMATLRERRLAQLKQECAF
jgi:hypothetical protein